MLKDLMPLAYLILTAVIALVIFVGTAHRHDSYRYWKFAALAALVWPMLAVLFTYLRIRRYLASRVKVTHIPSTGETIKAKWSSDVTEMKAYHTLEAEQAILEALGGNDE